MTSKGALEKLDHTLCLNHNKGNLKYNIDNEEHIDCVDMDEMLDCVETIEKDLKVLEILKKHLSFRKEWNNVFFEIDDCDVLLPFNDIEKEAIKEWLKQ